jgi:methionine-rich copper-binding protein CopC
MKQRQYAVLLIAPAFLALMLLLLTAPTAQADSTPQPLPFAQDWSNTGLITGNDIWIGVPGIVGYLGDFLPSSSPTGVNPQTVLTDTAASAVDVIANQTNPNTLTAGGVAEFDTLANPVVALQGSGTADAPFVQVNLNTTDKKNIVVVYKLRDVDGAADNAIQPVALHYRIGSVGSFTNVPAAFVADATSGPSLATLVTPVTVTLPSTANNQALVQIRILTTNAASSDEWVGIDDISVTGSPLDTPPTISSTTPISGATGVPTTTAPITLNFSEPVTATAGAITLECPAGSPITLSGLPASGASITVTPTVALPDFTICKVSALAANITDQDGTPDQLDGNGDGTGGDDYAFTFRTIAPGDPAPEVVSTMPISGATNVLVSANVAITFSEPLTVTTATFTITCASSGAHSVTLNGGPVGFTLNPDADFARSELCTVTVLAAQVSDQDAIDPPDNMVADYTFSFTTQPPDAAPAVVATSPISGATNVPINASIVVTFSEPVSATSASFAVNCPAPVGFTLSGGPTKFTLGNLVNGLCSSQYTVTVTAAAVTDLDNDDPPDAMAANYVFPFTMQPDPCTNTVTSISAIQGVTTTTPYAGQIVTTRGAVVGDYEGASPALRGFYIQDTGDGDPATSDGLFVFNASNNNVSVGQVVAVTGRAEEFESQTQIGGSVQVRVCPFGLVSPPADITLPIPAAVDGVPYLERFEGMLVRFPQTLYVTEHFQLGRFGQVVLTSNVDRLRQPTQIAAPGAPALAIQSANNLNRVILDDALYNQNPDPILYGRGGNPLSASNTLRAGDSAVDLVGVLSNSKATTEFAVNTTTNIITYRVRPTTNPDFQPTNPRPSAPETITGTVKVAAFNTLNFFNTFGSSCTNGVGGTTTSCRGASNSVEYSRQVSKTIPAMLGLDADVIGLMEIENDGYGSSSAIQEMVNRLNAATAPGTYALIDADALIGAGECARNRCDQGWLDLQTGARHPGWNDCSPEHRRIWPVQHGCRRHRAQPPAAGAGLCPEQQR